MVCHTNLFFFNSRTYRGCVRFRRWVSVFVLWVLELVHSNAQSWALPMIVLWPFPILLPSIWQRFIYWWVNLLLTVILPEELRAAHWHLYIPLWFILTELQMRRRNLPSISSSKSVSIRGSMIWPMEKASDWLIDWLIDWIINWLTDIF